MQNAHSSTESASHRFDPAWRAAKRLDDGRSSAVELLDECKSAFDAANTLVNALVVHDFDAARVVAAQRDLERRGGYPIGPLHGIPFSIKESFDVAGWPTTCGNPAHAANIASSDAAVVRRLKQAGAVLIGKTNVPLHLRDWQSYNDIYGTTRNPHDPGRTPGGSSGGSAAAVCTGMSYFDVGSDIGSSLRNPAHYCGVFSHKSSHGLISLAGHGIDGAGDTQDINVAGPIARSATDLELIFRALAVPASPVMQFALPGSRAQAIRDFRVGIMLQSPIAEVDAEVAGALEQLGRRLEREGVQVSWNVRPDIDLPALWRTYVLMLRAATSVHLDAAAFAAVLDLAGTAAAGDDSYAALQFDGTALRHRDWLLLEEARLRFAAAWDQFFDSYDVLLCPAAATAAFALDEAREPWQRRITVNGKPQPMTTQLFWAGHSGLCGLPSTVAPAGLTAAGLPVGVQIVARRYHDYTAMRFAQCLEQMDYCFTPPQMFNRYQTGESNALV